MAKIRVWDIEWDTDDEVVDDLPKEVLLNTLSYEEIMEIMYDMDTWSRDDYISSLLTDIYGFCVFGFNVDFVD